MSENKKNRCWKGYKPAKGKKPYSDGSCVKESKWEKFVSLKESAGCTCSCDGCKDGDCSSCSCEDCSCEGCGC